MLGRLSEGAPGPVPQGGRPHAGAPGGPQRPRTSPAAARERRRPGAPAFPLAPEDAAGRAGCGLPAAFPQRRRRRSPSPAPRGRAPGTFPAWSRARETRSPAAGGGGAASGVQSGDRGGHRQRAGAQGDESQVWGCPGARGAITPEAGGSSALAGEAFRARRTGGLAREVGAGGQPWETRGPASYGDGRELRRVRKAGRCFRPSPFPPRRCSPPAPILTPLRAPRPAGETRCGWVQPSLRILLQTPQGRAEGNHRPPQPLPAQPRVFLATLPALRI